jgi:hypothetical protein
MLTLALLCAYFDEGFADEPCLAATKIESVVTPDSITDDLRRQAVTLVRIYLTMRPAFSR